MCKYVCASGGSLSLVECNENTKIYGHKWLPSPNISSPKTKSISKLSYKTFMQLKHCTRTLQRPKIDSNCVKMIIIYHLNDDIPSLLHSTTPHRQLLHSFTTLQPQTLAIIIIQALSAHDIITLPGDIKTVAFSHSPCCVSNAMCSRNCCHRTKLTYCTSKW